jgi:hypothetical protein
MKVGTSFFQTPLNVDIFTCHASRMFLMAFRVGNPFHKNFSLLFPDPSEESLSMAAVALRNVFLK